MLQKLEKRSKEDLSKEELEDVVKHSEDVKEVMETQDEMLSDMEKKEDDIKTPENKVNEKEDRNMDKNKIKSLSVRATDEMFRKSSVPSVVNSDAFKEYRSAVAETEGNATPNTDGNSGITVPTTISDNIIEYLTEDAPAFALANKLNTGTGYVDILREKQLGTAGFVGELQDVPQTNAKFDKVRLAQKRVGSSMQLTQQLINDSQFNIVDYSTRYLARDMAKAIESSILVGDDKVNGFESVESMADQEHSVKLTPENLQYKDLINMYTTLNPSYLSGAVMIVSRPMFQAIAELNDRKDGSGNYLITSSVVSGDVGYKLFGSVPVYVSDTLNDAKTNIIFGNFSRGYTLMVKKGMNLTHVTNDSTQALSGGHLIVIDTYMDGAVTNPDAFVVANNTGKDVTTPQSTINNKQNGSTPAK